MTPELQRRVWRQVFSDLTSELPDGVPFVDRVATAQKDLNKLFQALENGRPASSIGQKCGMDREDSISVDLEGNLTTCQNVTAKGGHRIGSLDEYAKARLTTSWHWSHHANCRSCPVLTLCSGSCMYLSGEVRRPTCDGHFAYFMGNLAAGIFFLTGERLKSVAGDRVRLEGQNLVEF